jgi:hypothetical protein
MVTVDTAIHPGKLWVYDQRGGGNVTVPLPYATLAFDTLQNETDPRYSFSTRSAVWFDGAFWVGASDGGLIRVTPSGAVATIFCPGKDTVAFSFADFTPSRLDPGSAPSGRPDLTRRVIDLAPSGGVLWVLCEKALWSFDAGDTVWTRINDSSLSIQQYRSFAPRQLDDSTTQLYVQAKVTPASGAASAVHSYHSRLNLWQLFLGDSRTIAIFRPGAAGRVYGLDTLGNNIVQYRDTGSWNAQDLVNERAQKISINAISARIAANAFGDFRINDFRYAIAGPDTLFQVATDIGLFYSNNAHADEADSTPFTPERRKTSLKSNLGKTYAVPGIINNQHPETVFAYNLARKDRVTIDIFDYNMDHVVRITDNEEREAGNSRTSGRSTINSMDRWDGTTKKHGGAPVSPGVYFYRIKTAQGERAFGKIIVAKNLN